MENQPLALFTINPSAFAAIRKRLLVTTVPLLLLALAAGIFMATVNSKQAETDYLSLVISIPFMLVAAAWGINRSLGRQKQLLASYKLSISNNLITREQLNTPEVSIYFNEVLAIIKDKSGNLLIRGKVATDIIMVPAQINDYHLLEEKLLQIMPITTAEALPFYVKYKTLMAFGTIALMLCVYTATNRILVGISGIVLTAIMVWSYIETRKSKNIDNKTKRSLNWVIVVIISVVAVTLMKVLNPQQN